jgi:hypothetical protein
MPQLSSSSLYGSFEEFPKLQLDLLQTILVRASDQEGNTEVHRALLDSGAQHSVIIPSQFPTLKFIKRDLLGPFVFKGVSAEGKIPVTHRVTLLLRPFKQNSDQSMLIHPICFPRDTAWSVTMPDDIGQNLFKYKGLLADPDLLFTDGKYTFSIILSNFDSYCLLSGGKVPIDSMIYTRETPFGLVVGGRKPIPNCKGPIFFNLTTENEEEDCLLTSLNKLYNDQQLTKEILEFYRLDRVEIFGDPSENAQSSPDEFLKEYYSSLSRMDDGRVVARLPKQAHFAKTLSNNRKTGERRIKSVIRLLERRDRIAQLYSDMVHDWINKGVMIPTTIEEMNSHVSCELPHHGVRKETSTTTKLRVVIDGSAKDPGFASVNEYLAPGPNILSDLTEILLRWRDYSYFIIADIEKAFLQIQLHHEDSHLLNFRWVENINNSWETTFYRFIRLPWGIVAAPFVLNAVIRYLYLEYAQSHPESADLIEKLIKNTYMDDIFTPAESEEEAIQAAQISVQALKSGLFNVTKFRSFPGHLAQVISPESGLVPEYKVLGVRYFSGDDACAPGLDSIHEFDQLTTLTKKQIAGIGARIFDPLGFLCPFTLLSKKIRQELEVQAPKLKWEHDVPKNVFDQFREYIQQSDLLKDLRFPRKTWIGEKTDRKFFVFTDASGLALGAAIYCVSQKDDKTQSSLVFAKSKILPINQRVDRTTGESKVDNKPVLINRLELTAALMGVRLMQKVKKSLAIQEDIPISYLVDSENVLTWVRQGHHTLVYVDRRIKEILQYSAVNQWKKVNTKFNPADFASRGQTAKQLQENKLWFQGPEFIKIPESQWPLPEATLGAVVFARDSYRDNSDSEEEVIPESVVPTKTHSLPPTRPRYFIGRTWDENLQRGMKLLSFQRKCRLLLNKKRGILSTPASTLTQDTLLVEVSIASETQRYEHPDVFSALIADRIPRNLQSFVYGNGLYMSEEPLVRVIYSISRQTPAQEKIKLLTQGTSATDKAPFVGLRRTPARRQRARDLNDKFNLHFPVADSALLYLPRHSAAATQLVYAAHFASGHGSDQQTLTFLRRSFWIPRARTLVKSVRRRCVRCKQFLIRTFKQAEAPLPPFRLAGQPPFKVIGVDFTKPVTVIDRDFPNPSICVFACASTRIVLLEPTRDQTKESFCLAYDHVRFTRDINPTYIISDKARAFQKAQVQMYLTQKYSTTKWRFNAPFAPWWGGFYERMMRIIKETLNRVFDEFKFASWQHFCVALAYAERLINSRPLTFISDERSEYTPISPNQFLNPQSENNFSKTIGDLFLPLKDESMTINELIQRHEDQKYLYRRLLFSFQSAYIDSVRKFHSNRIFSHRAAEVALKVGDTVLIKPGTDFKAGAVAHKKLWKAARIIKIHYGHDQKPRAVDYELLEPEGSRLHRGTRAIQSISPAEIVNDGSNKAEKLPST